MLKLVLPALLSLVSPLAAAQDAEPAPFELYHWWGSAGERDAVTALRRYVEQLGVRWSESGRVQQGNLIGYRQTLAQRIEQGDGPDAAVVLSTDVRQLMNSNALLLLDDVAAANDWDEVVPHGGAAAFSRRRALGQHSHQHPFNQLDLAKRGASTPVGSTGAGYLG